MRSSASGSGALAEVAYRAIRAAARRDRWCRARHRLYLVQADDDGGRGKTLQGSYFGSCVPRIRLPRMLQLSMAGKLKLDETDHAPLLDRRGAGGVRRSRVVKNARE